MKEKIKEYIDILDDEDMLFLRQMYIIFKKHIEKKYPALPTKDKNISRCDQYRQDALRAIIKI